MLVSLDTVGLLRCFEGLTCNGCQSRTAVADTHEDGDVAPAYKEPIGVTMISGTL